MQRSDASAATSVSVAVHSNSADNESDSTKKHQSPFLSARVRHWFANQWRSRTSYLYIAILLFAALLLFARSKSDFNPNGSSAVSFVAAPLAVATTSAIHSFCAHPSGGQPLSWRPILLSSIDASSGRSSSQSSEGDGAGSLSGPPPVRLVPAPLPTIAPRHAVAILMSWSGPQCLQAFVTWRSIRRLDPHRHKDVLFALQDDGAPVDAGAAAGDEEEEAQSRSKSASGKSEVCGPSDALCRLRQEFQRSPGAAYKECEALVSLIHREYAQREEALQLLHQQQPAYSASTVGLGASSFAFFQPVPLPPRAHVRFPQWYFALHKLQLFTTGVERVAAVQPHDIQSLPTADASLSSIPLPTWRSRYERVMLLDSDIVLVQGLERYFPTIPRHDSSQCRSIQRLMEPTLPSADSPADLTGVHEQSSHCSRGNKLNGGVLSFRPSRSLHRAALRTLRLAPGGGCEPAGKELSEAEQSILNCMCGWGGETFTKALQAHDIKCSLLPSSLSIFSGDGDVLPSIKPCPYPPAEEVSALHFTWKPKPYQWESKECITPVSDTSSTTESAATSSVAKQTSDSSTTLAALPRQCYVGQSAMFTYWHCLAAGGFNLEDLRQQCRYAPTEAEE